MHGPHQLDPSLHRAIAVRAALHFPSTETIYVCLGGPTCLSCHFHLALRGHRDALYISAILKYHLLHLESN